MQYKSFVLDSFQEEAIHYIEKNHSVVVSAATGTGKTLIADYVIDKFLKEGKRVIYTAPIKALSNQKYKDFKKEYGDDKVGILTGDVTINHDGQVLIMTTEIYRNMLLSGDPITTGLSYVVFDEIHYISDAERGTVWEESIIFSPPHVRFLCLSATIPNAKQFATWIESIKKHPVDVVNYEKRAVPLDHYVYDQELGVVKVEAVKKKKQYDQEHDYYRHFPSHKNQKKKKLTLPPSHIDLVRILYQEEKLPCIFFVFSRLGTEKRATELARTVDFLNAKEKSNVIEIFNSLMSEDARNMESTQLLKKVLLRGVGIHHAGLLPIQKEIVEELFGRGLIRVLYATETFAVGINYPARTVCFHSLDKYDGVNFRYMNSKEYFQMAGRAGRRGIDTVGYAIAMVDRYMADLDRILKLTSKDIDPIISQFKLSVNTILNMIRSHTDAEIEILLKSNFDYFLLKSSQKQIRILSSYNARTKKLLAMGYLRHSTEKGKSFQITEKGEFGTHIYSNELLITELFYGNFYKKLTFDEMMLLLAVLIYEPRRGISFKQSKEKNICESLWRKLMDKPFVLKQLNKRVLYDLVGIVTHWSREGEFAELLDLATMQEGDYIRLFRQMTDVLSQIKRATTDMELEEKVVNCINTIYRDVVKVEFGS